MTKIAFIGTNLPNEIEQKSELISAAGNRYQNNFITSLRMIGYEISNLSFVHLEENQLADELLTCKEATAQYVILRSKNITDRFKAYIEFQKKLKEVIKSSDMVISYNIVYCWFRLPHLARKYNKKSIVILADYSGPECFSSYVRKMYANLMKHVMRKYQCVIALSKEIEDYIDQTQKFCLMEGGIDSSLYQEFDEDDSAMQQWLDSPWNTENKKILMYSGLLNEVTGVDLLLDTMKHCQCKNMELWITGKGPLKQQVEQAALEDDRIKYLGHLPYQQYLNCLKKVDVLVNSRNMNLPENRNNFPSKIMDYLASGKPIVSTSFMGSEIFDQYINFCDSDEIMLAQELEGLLENLDQWSKQSIYNRNRKLASQFLWINQLKKIF